MTQDETLILQEAEEAYRQLQEQLEEAKSQRDRIWQTGRLFFALNRFTLMFRNFGILLIALGILKVTGTVIEGIGILSQTVFDLLPIQEPLLLGLSLFIASVVFGQILRYLLPEGEILEKIDSEVDKAEQILTRFDLLLSQVSQEAIYE